MRVKLRAKAKEIILPQLFGPEKFFQGEEIKYLSAPTKSSSLSMGKLSAMVKYLLDKTTSPFNEQNKHFFYIYNIKRILARAIDIFYRYYIVTDANRLANRYLPFVILIL